MLPDQRGTYVLILRLSRPTTASVGRLGRFRFPAGWYTYVGSAHGPGGLVARISRHLRSPKARHWHVDYLRTHGQPVEIWYTVEPQKRECAWAQALSTLPGASIPAPRFGASDCRCPAHMIHFTEPPDLAAFARVVGETVSREKLNV
jgi:Uri superfamily endonuclease